MTRARWTVVLIILVTVGLGLTNIAVAKKQPKGLDLYKEYCKSCHGPDSDNGEYTPMTLIQDQWNRFFDEKYADTHKDVVDPNHDNQKVIDAISDDDLSEIREFLVDHAADSEHPMTCG